MGKEPPRLSRPKDTLKPCNQWQMTMRKFPKVPVWLIAIPALILVVNGCALVDRLRGSLDDKGPSELMYQGMSDMERGRYTAASKAFQALKDRYPYSELAPEAKLRMADALYRLELYEEAYDAYDEFERLHPINPAVPYALYQKGMSYFSQIRNVDRDQAPTRRARDEFERLLQRYPDSDYSFRARRKLRECYAYLAGQELFIADFYLKKKQYRAAKERYRYLLENYPDFGQYHRAIENLNTAMQHLEAIGDEEGDARPSWWRRIIPMD